MGLEEPAAPPVEMTLSHDGSAALAAELAPQLAELLRQQALQRQSLPVRAVREGYKLTRLGAAILGLLVTIAEVVSSDHSIFRAIFRALFVWVGGGTD